MTHFIVFYDVNNIHTKNHESTYPFPTAKMVFLYWYILAQKSHFSPFLTRYPKKTRKTWGLSFFPLNIWPKSKIMVTGIFNLITSFLFINVQNAVFGIFRIICRQNLTFWLDIPRKVEGIQAWVFFRLIIDVRRKQCWQDFPICLIVFYFQISKITFSGFFAFFTQSTFQSF